MTEDDLIKIGFKRIPHFTVMNSLVYDLGRRRHLSIGCVGTPNEMIFLCEADYKSEKKIDDSICVHNYDYDGYVTEERIDALIFGITGKNRDKF